MKFISLLFLFQFSLSIYAVEPDCITCDGQDYFQTHGVSAPEGLSEIQKLAYAKAFQEYSTNPKTLNAISIIEKNVSKCLRIQTVRGVRVCTRVGQAKEANRSIGLCTKYVKHALWEKEPRFMESYPGTVYAVDSGDFLKEAGFSNLLDLDSFKNMTPSSAPKGAVLVYRNTSRRDGRAGHVEIKLDDNKFGSDHLNTRAISDYHPHRELIGIYIQIPQELSR